MTEIMACLVGCAIGAFFVGVIIVALIAVINSNICSSGSKEEDISLKTELK